MADRESLNTGQEAQSVISESCSTSLAQLGSAADLGARKDIGS